MTWSAKQYTIFEAERSRPVRDLLGALPELKAGSVVDLGCGPGNSTEALAARFPGAAVCGLDSSADMIASARQRLPQIPFTVADAQDWSDRGPFDVILANAVLQWIPNHATVLPALIGKLSAGGALAIQMPDNLDTPAHQLMREVAASGPWSDALAGAAGARATIESVEWYYELLRPLCARVDIWRTIYHHPLAGGPAAIVEWFKGSGLRPFLEPLNHEERGEYVKRYTVALGDAYRTLDDGSVLLPFPRLFAVAVRA